MIHMYIRVCPTCGIEFKTRWHKIFCSEKCRKNKNKPIYKKKCIVCGKIFFTKNNHKQICSKKCRKERRKKQHKKKEEIQYKKECIVCGKIFFTTNSLKKICSEYCKKERRKYYKQKRKEKQSSHYLTDPYDYQSAYYFLSEKNKVPVDILKKKIPSCFIKRELECWDTGKSYFLDFIIPAHKRANGKCEITNEKTHNLVVHHLDGYNWYIDGRMDLNNCVVISRKLHKAFHKKYGYGNNTAEQFWKFVEEYKKGLIMLDDFKE